MLEIYMTFGKSEIQNRILYIECTLQFLDLFLHIVKANTKLIA